MATREKFNTCETLAWIAFRRDDMLTKDPDELRANMRRYKKRLVVKNPAAELLKFTRSGDLTVLRQPMLPITSEGVSKMSPVDWMQISEEDIWRRAEFEWRVAQGKITWEVRSVPALRTVMIADDGREFSDMGQAFVEWMDATLSKDEELKVYQTGDVTAKQCKRFWQWLGRTDKVPRELKLYYNREDFEKFIATLPPKK
jgi:hypothetical protein